ncbi:MAG: chromosome partitioning protein ParB, partial [Planctomycetia bacterium]
MSRERRLGRGLEALLGRAGLEPATATPAVQGTAALASQPAPRPAPGGLGAGAARLFLHAPEELEKSAAALPVTEVRADSIDPNPWQPRSIVNDADLAELVA